jgi:hypothetical protein
MCIKEGVFIAAVALSPIRTSPAGGTPAGRHRADRLGLVGLVPARVAEDRPNAERGPPHEHEYADDPDSDINDWWIVMVEPAGVTQSISRRSCRGKHRPAPAIPKACPAPADTSWKAPSSLQAPAVVATEFESREERSYLVSEGGVEAIGAPSAPTDHHALGLKEERSADYAHQERSRQATSEETFAQVSDVFATQSTSLPEAPLGASPLIEEGALLEERTAGERFVAAADQERPSISEPEIAAGERCGARSSEADLLGYVPAGRMD